MAAGKLSPRQRMINMMYLVLTALLALNVSKEVLNSFFEVNKGIERTTTNFSLKNGSTYADFDNAVANNPEKFQKVRDQAYSVKTKVDATVLYIQEMKYDLVSKADKGKVYLGSAKDVLDEDGKPIEEKVIEGKKFSELSDAQKRLPIAYLYNKENRDAAGDLFYPNTLEKDKRASVLKKQIEEYRDFLIGLAGNNQTLIDNINLACDVSNRGKGKKLENWETYNFVDMPSVGALTILSKIQSDLRNLEADMIEYLKRDIDAKTLKFDDAKGVAIPQSNFVLSGDVFEADIFITAMNKNQNPEIYIGEYDTINDKPSGGTKIDVQNGVGVFQTRTSGEGPKKWGGIIKLQTEQGPKFYPFKGEYLVASKQAVASPTNMNVLYVAVDNPIKVAVAGYSAAQVTAETKNGTIRVVDKNNGQWIVNPTKRNDKNSPVVDLYVTVDGKRKLMGSVDFKVKDVPAPVPKAAKIEKKAVSKGELKAAQMLIAEMKDFYFDRNALSFKIVSYRMNYTSPKGSFPIEVKGTRFTDQVLDAINNAVVGSTVSFTDIKAKRTGVSGLRDLGDVVYTIKN